MSAQRFSLVVLGAVLMVAAIGCEKEPNSPEITPPVPSRVYEVTVLSGNGPVQNAIVSVPTRSSTYLAYSDRSGICRITIPDTVDLPPYVVATIDHPKIVPDAVTFPGTRSTESQRSHYCEPVRGQVLVREARLHHLGNDQYSGPENSQLQIPTEGISLTFSFYLSSIPSQMPLYRLCARGVQHPTKIKVNGVTTKTLGDSNANGDLGRYNHQLNGTSRQILRVGMNTMTIETGEYSEWDPWDDIEFCGLIVYYP